jgi:AAA family ATP:ADP antiporter
MVKRFRYVAAMSGSNEATSTTGERGVFLGASRHEWPALVWSFVYFFSLLAGYFVLRPLRDALGTAHRIEWLFSGTFVVMLLLVPVYGALVSRLPRRRFLPIVYGFFIACLLVFHVQLQVETGASLRSAAFFVWVAVFNLFAVSVFWSFMSDIFSTGQAKRFYGAIGAGGTSGAMVGSLLTINLVEHLGVPNMLLVSAALIGIALVAILRLVPWARAQEQRLGWQAGEDAIGGSVFGGARLILGSRFLQSACLMMFLGVAVGTWLYNMQQGYARVAIPDAADRAQFFSRLDLAINFIVIIVQLTLTRFLLVRYGVGPMLLVPVILVSMGFLALAANPIPALLAAVQIGTRAGHFALQQPARESLFTRVDRESRYKSKNFIDTVIYRGGDVSIAWIFSFVVAAVSGSKTILAGVGFALALAMIGAVIWVVREQRHLPAEGHASSGDSMLRSRDPA